MPEDPEVIRKIVERTRVEPSQVLLGDVLLERELITKEQLTSALHIKRLDQDKRLGQILVERNIITDEQRTEALKYQQSLSDQRKPPPVWPEWRSLRHKIIESLGRGRNVFLHGLWGTSKSFMISEILRDIKSERPNFVIAYEEFTSPGKITQDMLRRFKENGENVKRYGVDPGFKLSKEEAIEWSLFVLRNTKNQYYLLIDSKGKTVPKKSTVASLSDIAASRSLSLLTCAQQKVPELVGLYGNAEVFEMPTLKRKEALAFIKHIFVAYKKELPREVRDLIDDEDTVKREAYINGLVNMGEGRPGKIRKLIAEESTENIIARKHPKLIHKTGEAQFMEMKWVVLLAIVLVMSARGLGGTYSSMETKIVAQITGGIAWLAFWILMRIGQKFGAGKPD